MYEYSFFENFPRDRPHNANHASVICSRSINLSVSFSFSRSFSVLSCNVLKERDVLLRGLKGSLISK